MDRPVVGGRPVERADDDVVDISEIALHCPVVVQLQRPPTQHGFGETPQRDIGASPRAVDGEEAQVCLQQAEQRSMAFSEQLVGALGRCIERSGRVGAVVDAERQLGVGPVNRRLRRLDKVRISAGYAPVQAR